MVRCATHRRHARRRAGAGLAAGGAALADCGAGRGQVWGTPKSYEQREVPIPRFLINDIAEHVRDKSRDDLVFTGVRSGTALRAASLAVASGANVKSRPADARAQVRDRHLDQYGHLFGDDLDTIADRLDVQARTARTSCGLFADCGRVDQAAVGRSGSYSPVNTGLSAWCPRQCAPDSAPDTQCPRQDSNLRSRLRRAVLYPLSYGGVRPDRPYGRPC